MKLSKTELSLIATLRQNDFYKIYMAAACFDNGIKLLINSNEDFVVIEPDENEKENIIDFCCDLDALLFDLSQEKVKQSKFRTVI